MNRANNASLLKRGAAAFLGLLVSIGFTAVATSSATAGPLEVEVSLSSDIVMEGEPILVNYKITNSSEQKAYLSLGAERRGWLNLKLNDAGGHAVAAHPEVKRRNPRYEGPMGSDIYLSSNSENEGSIVLSRWVSAPSAGSYTLLLNVRLPYALGTDGDSSLKPQSESGHRMLTKQIVLPITVTKADATRLSAIAESIRESILHSDDLQRDIAIQQLFAMPTQYALPSQRALVMDPNLSKRDLQIIFIRLSGIGSVPIVDFLQDAAWTLDMEIARSTLATLHLYGDEVLKSKIERMFADHGQKVPRAIVDNG